MNVLLDTFSHTGTIHHAYIIEGDKQVVVKDLRLFLEQKIGVGLQANPDFWSEDYETFGIEDARQLKERQATKAISGGKKIFIITTYGMTHEAQNSLLKIFEEPTAETHFFLIVPSSEIFLPTLRSRVVVFRHTDTSPRTQDQGQDLKGVLSIDLFFKASIPERLRMVVDIVEEKDKARAAYFIDAVISKIRLAKDIHKMNGTDIRKIEDLITCRSFLNDRSPSLKLILEHTCLIV